MSRVKVAIVVVGDILAADGTMVRVHRVLELLQKSCSITVIASSSKNQSYLTGMEDVNIKGLGMRQFMQEGIPIPIKLIFMFLWNLKLVCILLKNRFDVAYLVHDWFGFLSVYLVSKIKKYRVIFEAHSIFSRDFEEYGHSGIVLKLDRSLERFVVKHSNFIMALSNDTLEFYQVYNKKIDLFRVFVDATIFKATVRPKITDYKLIGLIGPFDASIRQKHYLDFLYSRINDFDSRIRFLVIGQCNDKISHDRIIYSGYLDSVHDYVDQLSRLNAALVPEKVSTQGPLNKIIESMACSLPVFTTPKGTVGLDPVVPGKDLLVFEENDLVNKINELIFDNEFMDEIGRTARRTAEQYYSKKANEQKLMKVLQLVIEE